MLGLLPSAALARDAAQAVDSAEAFAAMEPDGNYVLTGDITVSSPYGQPFGGTFDGGGHTVTLAISATSKRPVRSAAPIRWAALPASAPVPSKTA